MPGPVEIGFSAGRSISTMDGIERAAGEENMFAFSKRTTLIRQPGTLKCPRCGSDATAWYRASGRHYCFRCSRFFQDAAEVLFDVVADGWTPALGALQAAGEIVSVRLPSGFYGVCVLQGPIGHGIRNGGAV